MVDVYIRVNLFQAIQDCRERKLWEFLIWQLVNPCYSPGVFSAGRFTPCGTHFRGSGKWAVPKGAPWDLMYYCMLFPDGILFSPGWRGIRRTNMIPGSEANRVDLV